MLLFNDPLVLVLVILLSASGGWYVFRLIRLGIPDTEQDEEDDVNHRTRKLMDRYRREHDR